MRNYLAVRNFVGAILVLGVIAPPSFGLVLNFQGRLTDRNNNNVTLQGTHELTFTLYDAEAGGAQIREALFQSGN